MFGFEKKYYRLEQIQASNPIADNSKICHLLAGYEFPWDITRSLELAMMKTYCVTSISQLLDRTGEFHHHTQKRYEDTGLLIAEIMKWGYKSDRGQKSVRRINRIHNHYQIRNEDFLYVLSTFIFEAFGFSPPAEITRSLIARSLKLIARRSLIRKDNKEKFNAYHC